jgi:hypothetical protein
VVLHFAVAVFAPLVSRHAKAADGSALRGITQLGIAAKISHDNYSVKGHEEPFFNLGFLTTRYYKRKTEESSDPIFLTR